MRWRACWLLFAVWLLGCERVPTAPLLELSSVTPKRIELGDELEIEGASLPEGRDARVVLRGTLYRPNESPDDEEIETTGRVVSRDRILVPVNDELLGSLCGEGRSAVHTTFVGSVDVVFASQRPGAPPVSGTVEGVELDATPQGVRRDQEEGVRALASIGVHLKSPSTDEGSSGLSIASVDPGSRAEAAGIGAGDRLLSFANVRVIDPSDVALPPGRTSTTARIAHGPESEHASVADGEELTISIDGVAPPARGRVTLGLALAALVAVAIFALIGPFARALAWTERRLGEGLVVRQSPVSASAVALLLAGAVILPLGKALFAARVDLALVTVTVQLAWLALSLSSARGLKEAASTTLEHAARFVPVLAAILVIGARDGALAVGDVLRAQGAAPWEMTVARSPVGVALLALTLAPWLLPSSDNEGGRARVPAMLSCAVAVASLLGGWRFFGVAPNHLSALGLATFLVKVGLLYWVVGWVRRSLPPVSTRAWIRFVWPTAAAVVGADLICQRLAVPPMAGAITGLGALALMAFVLLRAKRISSGDSPRVHADALL